MSEPRTAAGRALLRDTADKRLWVGPFDTVLDAILAIEAEAVTPPASAEREADAAMLVDDFLGSLDTSHMSSDQRDAFAAARKRLVSNLRAAEARDETGGAL